MEKHDEEAGNRLRKKKEFYAGLDSSTDSEDGTPDPGRESSVQAMHKGAARKQTLLKEAHANGLSRSISDSNLLTKMKPNATRPKETEARPSTSCNGKTGLPGSLATRHTFSDQPNKPMANAERPSTSKAIGKRKRTTSGHIDRVSDERQIFKGLHFYFFPNTDTNPARKMRIAKALEFGATWEKEFNDSVSHVVVDKSMNYDLLTKFLKKDSLPARVAIVSEDYPAECISYRVLLDPKQLQFKVKGHEQQMTSSRPGSSDSDKSLLLKPAGKAVAARQPETPDESRRRAPTPPPADSSDGDEDEDVEFPQTTIRPEKPDGSNVQSTEEFEAAIRQARQLQNIPLDNDDEAVSRPTSSEGPGTDDEQQKPGLQFLKKKKTKFDRFQDKFQCMQKHIGSKTETPNADTIAILQQMADYYGQVGDEWRLRAYRKAIATLRNHPTKVWTKEEALALPQIGERLASKIEECAYTNRLRRLENARAEPSDQVLQTFMQVYGAGFAQASKWVSAGYTTLDELLERADLTDNQRIGIEHYEDFSSRIPRAEVEQHGSIVRKTLQKVDAACEVIIGGSYRRGSDMSGDIDCIITRPDTGIAHIRQIVLDQLVPKLFAKKFLVAELAATSRDDGSKWHGASRIPPSKPGLRRDPWRRIDLLLVPSAELGAALIYFTGNDIFNRSMRLLAGTKGMRLNQRGLYKDVIRGKGREKLSEGTLVEGRDEKRIFEVLGVPWRPPEHRIC